MQAEIAVPLPCHVKRCSVTRLCADALQRANYARILFALEVRPRNVLASHTFAFKELSRCCTIPPNAELIIQLTQRNRSHIEGQIETIIFVNYKQLSRHSSIDNHGGIGKDFKDSGRAS